MQDENSLTVSRCFTMWQTSETHEALPFIRLPTHSQLSPEEQMKTGVTDGYVRLSLGIEHVDDIIADLDQALAVS